MGQSVDRGKGFKERSGYPSKKLVNDVARADQNRDNATGAGATKILGREFDSRFRVRMLMMSTPDSGSAEPWGKRPIPLWAAVLSFGVILICGAGLIWKYVYQPPKPPNAIRAIVPPVGGPRVAARDMGPSPMRAEALQAGAEAGWACG